MLKDAVVLILILGTVFAVVVFLMLGGPEAKRVLEWFRQATMDGLPWPMGLSERGAMSGGPAGDRRPAFPARALC